MTETATLTLTDFLLARIAEDEDQRNVDLRPWPFDYSLGDVAEAQRWKAECEAKRRIVNAWRSGFPEEDRYSTGWHDFHVHALCLYAAVYADHPDYRDEWRP